MNYKKVTAVTLSTFLLVGGALPAFANTSSKTNQASSSSKESSSVIEEKDVQNDVDVEKLIQRIRDLFPSKFDFVSDNEFELDMFSSFRKDEVETYSIRFHKREGARESKYGNFEFAGEDLDLIRFHYQNGDEKDSLFPPKVSQEEAQEIASAFINKMLPNVTFKIQEDHRYNFYDRNRPLTEPIEYHFNFQQEMNGVTIQDKWINVTVLGNGEVRSFNTRPDNRNVTFEKKTGLISNDEAKQKLIEDLEMDLRYQVARTKQDETPTINLVYSPTIMVQGIDAQTGAFKTSNEYVEKLSSERELKMLPKSTQQEKSITKEEAKDIAKKLLEPKSDHVELFIEGAVEREHHEGFDIYDVQFMYRTGNSGSGSSIQLKKSTGEIVNFHGYHDERFGFGENEDEEISKDEALQKAVEYVKQYAFTNMDEFAYPLIDEGKRQVGRLDEAYSFNFPRVKDGLQVMGDFISVTVSEQGDFLSLNKHYTDIEKWPERSKVVQKEKALEDYKKQIELQLKYMRDNRQKENGENIDEKYELIYDVSYNKYGHYYDALSGKWERAHNGSQEGEKDSNVKVSHPWAEKELNFMIQANIIQVDDESAFDGDASVTKGEALEILSKSLMRFYSYDRTYADDNRKRTFENIDTDHELFQIIERAAENGIIDTTKSTFEVDEVISREELAFWYIRALALEKVALLENVFKNPFADKGEVSSSYEGFVVLANALGLLTKDENNQFHPQQDVSYAQLAASNIRLAKKMAEMERSWRY